MRISQVLAANFRHWGVTHVFGIPGKAISPLLLDTDYQNIRFVCTRHESGAGFAAAGHAMFSGTVGVALVTSGPGATNALTSAAQAKAFNAPVLFISGQPSAGEAGKPWGQDSSMFGSDAVRLYEPVTLFSARVERPDTVEMYVRHALEKACSGPRGPVHLCIPFDVLMADSGLFLVDYPDPISHVMAPDSDIQAAVRLLDVARRPVAILGKGVHAARAFEEVRTMVEYWGIPVITTPGGKGVFPSTHPLSLGNYGLGGSPEAAEYLRSGVDLMVVVGTKLSDMSLSGLTPLEYPQQVLHFDYDYTFTGKAIPVPTRVVLGDARLNLQRVIAQVPPMFKPQTRAPLKSSSTVIQTANALTTGKLSSVIAIKVVRKSLPKDAIVFGDDGSHTFYAIRHYDVFEPGTFIFDDVFGAMGHPIGYSIGAKLASPASTIVCLTGDGCTFMHGAEISTAVNEGASVLFIVFNNERLDMVDKGMSFNTGRTVGAIYERPLDVRAFAASMGADSLRCTDEGEIESAIGIALASHRPFVVEIMVDPDEIPPIMTRLLSIE